MIETGKCPYCEKEVNRGLMYACNGCGRAYCVSHRAPGRHECISDPASIRKRRRYRAGPATHTKETKKSMREWAAACRTGGESGVKGDGAAGNGNEKGVVSKWINSVLLAAGLREEKGK